MAKRRYSKNTGSISPHTKNITALYGRVSTEAQAEEGYSIEAQKERMIAYCVSQGITDYELYLDPGWSGSNLERPEMQRLINDVQSQKICRVVCYKLDRISRSQRDTLYLIEDVLIPNGVSFVSMSETLDTGTPMGRLMIGILSAFAQLERENIRERTQMGMKARVASGLWPGGDRIPLGYDYDPETGILMPNDKADTVRKCFDLYLTGMSPQHIADITGLAYGAWVANILIRKTYIGIISYKGEDYKGKHEPLVSEDTFWRVQKRISDRSINRLTVSRHLLTGMMRCGYCGGPMHYQSWGKGKSKIGCYSKQSSKQYLITDPDCQSKWLDPDDVEQAVMNDVFSLRMHIPEPDQKNRQKEIETETEYLGKQMRELEGQAKRLYTLYAQVSDPMLINAVRDINKRREEIEQRLAVLQETTTSFGLEDSIFDTVESLKKTWDLMNINERRNVLNSIISSITIKEGEINIMYRIGGIS